VVRRDGKGKGEMGREGREGERETQNGRGGRAMAMASSLKPSFYANASHHSLPFLQD